MNVSSLRPERSASANSATSAYSIDWRDVFYPKKVECQCEAPMVRKNASVRSYQSLHRQKINTEKPYCSSGTIYDVITLSKYSFQKRIVYPLQY